MSETAEYLVVPGSAQDEVHPAMEVCLDIASRGDLATLVIPSHLSSAIPPSFTSKPLVAVTQIASSSGPPTHLSDPVNQPFGRDLAAYLEKRRTAGGGELPRKLYAVVGVDVDWTTKVFWELDVTKDPLSIVLYLRIERQRLLKELSSHVRPGESRVLAGPPTELVFALSDLHKEFFELTQFGLPGPGPRAGGGGGGPPKLGDRPPWVPEFEGSIGLMFNESADHYMGYQMKMPVSGIGPFPPEQYWKTSDSVIYSREIRQHGRESNVMEDEVNQWLDSKPRGSVLYVAFGSEVSPDEEELAQLAAAVEKSTRPFIWVVGSKSGGDFADGMEGRVGDRGLIIRGWAPHLLILSHPSTGGFLSHRGLNPMVEVVGQAVPLQAWPSRGDQHHNAKLGVSHRHQKMGKLFGWNSIAETITHRSPFGTRPFPGKRYYNTHSPGDDHKTGHVASKDTPKNVMDDESKGICKTMASKAFASFQFDLNFEFQMGCFRLGASISRLAKRMR